MNYKKDFPIFNKRSKLIYLDNAATSQKPKIVIDAISDFYTTKNSNIHRGPNFLAEEATLAYENARKKTAEFINSKYKHEIIFTRNATESINLIARSYGETFLKKGDEIIISKAEHHANIVPWLQLKEKIGIKLKYFEVSENGEIIFTPSLITKKTKLVSVTSMSNVTGAITDLKPIISSAHKAGSKVIVDACQMAVHSPIDVIDMNVDFLVFSAHKMYGPTGIGVLYAKEEILKTMPPFLGGGDMVNEVTEDHFSFASLPNKFEAGTPNMAGAVGMKTAIEYIQDIGITEIQKIENSLTDYLLRKLKQLPYIRIIGPKTANNRGPVVSFLMKGVHPHDIAEGLSKEGICIRAGHHCCQILMNKLKISGTARISMAFYNTKEDVDRAIEVLGEVHQYFC